MVAPTPFPVALGSGWFEPLAPFRFHAGSDLSSFWDLTLGCLRKQWGPLFISFWLRKEHLEEPSPGTGMSLMYRTMVPGHGGAALCCRGMSLGQCCLKGVWDSGSAVRKIILEISRMSAQYVGTVSSFCRSVFIFAVGQGLARCVQPVPSDCFPALVQLSVISQNNPPQTFNCSKAVCFFSLFSFQHTELGKVMMINITALFPKAVG